MFQNCCMVAMYFHLPLLNPYLARRSDFSNGANFAVAGATALDPAALAARNVSLPLTRSTLARQIRWFKYLLHSTLSNPRGTFYFIPLRVRSFHLKKIRIYQTWLTLIDPYQNLLFSVMLDLIANLIWIYWTLNFMFRVKRTHPRYNYKSTTIHFFCWPYFLVKLRVHLVARLLGFHIFGRLIFLMMIKIT